MNTSKKHCIEYLKCLRSHPLSLAVREVTDNKSLHKESIFFNNPQGTEKDEDKQIEACLKTPHSPQLDRVIGSLVGLAVADSLGTLCNLINSLVS